MNKPATISELRTRKRSSEVQFPEACWKTIVYHIRGVVKSICINTDSNKMYFIRSHFSWKFILKKYETVASFLNQFTKKKYLWFPYNYLNRVLNAFRIKLHENLIVISKNVSLFEYTCRQFVAHHYFTYISIILGMLINQSFLIFIFKN